MRSYALGPIAFLVACGGAEDPKTSGPSGEKEAPKSNHCTFSLSGDTTSGLEAKSKEIDTEIPPMTNGLEPLVAGSHGALGTLSGVTCQNFESQEETADFSILFPGKLDAVAPVSITEASDVYASAGANVRLGDYSWKCISMNARDFPKTPQEPIGTFSFSLDSATPGVSGSGITWYGIHGRGHAECPGTDEDTPGIATVDIVF